MPAVLTDLQHFHTLILRLRDTSSLKVKEAELIKSLRVQPQLRDYLEAVFNPWRQFHLTSETVMRKFKPSSDWMVYRPVLSTLSKLETRMLSGNLAGQEWRNLIEGLGIYGETANLLLDKDIKCRVGVATINKALKEANLLPIRTFEIALGNPYVNERFWEDDEIAWYVSRKLDGIRCLAIRQEDGTIELRSRTGILFTTLRTLIKSLEGMPCGVVLDGELALRRADGSDDFQGIMKEIHKKDHDIVDVVYHVFDVLPLAAFVAMRCPTPFRERLDRLYTIVENLNTERVVMVMQKRCRNEQTFKNLQDAAGHMDWEGLIARADVPYVGKRTAHLLKVKTFFDCECVVTAVETGPFSIVEAGKEKTIQTMTNVVVDYKGHMVRVGSGFSLKERNLFFWHPERIVGKIITVKYFEETKNQQGGVSLRFPTCKTIHGEARTV